MSEVDARPLPTRGRSSHRGGRGGFGRGSTRGGRKPVNGASADVPPTEDSFEDQGELGEMKKKYATELPMLKDMFPDWTDVDLVFALQEADGDIPSTVDRITQGNVSQFSEVKSAKDRARSKVKEAPPAAGAPEKAALRGARARGGLDGTRGGRIRGSDRGRGGSRGARGGAHTSINGAAKEVAASIPTAESTAWDDSSHLTTAEGSWDTQVQEAAKDPGETGQSAWANVVTAETTPATASEGGKSSLIPEGGAKKSWASMFAAKPATLPVKKTAAPQPVPPPPAELAGSGEAPAPADQYVQEESIIPPVSDNQEPTLSNEAHASPLEPAGSDGAELTITPTKNPLTEENVEHIPDDSHPPGTLTVASTAGSVDPRNLTPLPAQQAPIARPPMGGYALSAHRAAGMPGRSASFQRRVQEQQEAVVMPGHNALDRAAVQFGSMGLNGEPGPDVDEDREEPETRHAPQSSPPSQPKTSLPQGPRQTAAPLEPIMPENLRTPKQAPGLPPASQQNQQQIQDVAMAPPGTSEMTQINQNYNQYGRYVQPGPQQESGAQQQKPYDPFSHQAQASQYDQYGANPQQPQHQHQQSQAGFGGLSSAPNDYSSYYTSDQQRGGYGNYYGSSYGPQDVRSQMGQGQQEAGMGQQRSTSGFGAAAPHDSAFASQAQQQVSIPTSLLQLNAALESCSNEHEHQFLLNEIQRVVSNVHTHTQSSTVDKAHGAPAMNFGKTPLDLVTKDGQGKSIREQVFASHPPLSDITNRSAHVPSPHPQTSTKAYISNQHSKQAQSRFGDTTSGSGHNTPNPPMGGQQQGGLNAPQQPQQQSMHQGPSHHQQGAYGAQSGFPYGHQYYNSPYPQAYQAHYYNSGNQQLGGYGGYPAKHTSMYGGSHGYGMGPQSSYDQHSASPANASAFGQNQSGMRSTSGMSSGLGGLDDYGRGSAQSQQQSGGFGGGSMNDPFGQRSSSGFGGAQSGYSQQSMAGQEDTLKPYSEASKSGPSPVLGQPGGRPGSAANSAGGTNQSGLPPPQSHQSGFGSGYPGFAGQGQYGGLGGLGTQQHGQGGYGSYGAGGFNQTYGSYNSRGGWGSNYGAH